MLGLCTALADLGGRTQRTTSLRVQILFRNVTTSGVGAPPPLTRSTPRMGKSWIHHCTVNVNSIITNNDTNVLATSQWQT